MRYIDLSLSKVVRIGIIVILLFGSVVYTYVWREATFGATPLVGSAQMSLEEAAVTGVFGAFRAAYALAHIPGDLASNAASTNTRYATAVPVLTYHRLMLHDDGSNVTVYNFAQQMQTLADRGWHTVTLADYEAFIRGQKQLPERSFLLTFDDDAQASFYPSDPILKILGFNAVEYVIVAATGIEGSSYYMSPVQINDMLRTGRWEIGSHSYDAHHPYPVDAAGDTGVFYTDKLWLPDKGRLETDAEFAARVDNDLAVSRQDLQDTYHVNVDTIAFPFGLEAGIHSADNYPEGDSVTIDLAGKHYSIGWQQTDRRDFTFMYPEYAGFVQYRIHVDHDWTGTQLADFLEGGIPKNLPYDDALSDSSGWRASWGDVKTGNVVQLSSLSGQSSASSILDGTRLWKDYAITATASWKDGDAFLLGDATDSRTYRSCVFGGGEAAIHDTTATTDTVIARKSDPGVVPEDGVQLGMRITPQGIVCSYGGRDVVTAPIPSRQGGVGVQVWNPALGAASLSITKFSVSP